MDNKKPLKKIIEKKVTGVVKETTVNAAEKKQKISPPKSDAKNQKTHNEPDNSIAKKIKPKTAQKVNKPTVAELLLDETKKGSTTNPKKMPLSTKTIKTKEGKQTAKKAKANPIEITHEVVLPKKTASSAIEKIVFQLKYSTVVGQSLYVSGNHLLLGNNDFAKAFPLTYLNNEFWLGVLEVPKGTSFPDKVVYNYLLKSNDGTFTSDWGNDKLIDTSELKAAQLYFNDTWNDASAVENTFYTEPFQEVLLANRFTSTVGKKVTGTKTHLFKVKAPLLEKGQVLFITGSAKKMGEWNIEDPIILSATKGEAWHTVSLDLSGEDFPIAYKYGVYDIEKNEFVTYENGTNRVLYEDAAADKFTVISDGFANIPYPAFKGAGVAIPVFSLRSQNSFGVGEFNDLKLLVDWAAKVGLKLVQLLPINDTTATHTFTDSYPYAAISAFALHPLYLHLSSVAGNENLPLLKSLDAKQEQLNGLAEVDYVEVMKTKWDIIKTIFPLQKNSTFNDIDFKSFFNENAHWLVPYAAFCYFREKYGTCEFDQWPTNSQYNETAIEQLADSPTKADDAISIHYFVQYHLHIQLREATVYAHSNGIIVKGDIPIGIYRHSCDAWQQPQLYNMDMQAGAPPDDFAVKGQNWGFPTYNWLRMKEDGFSWWKKRFQQMSYYFDAFRIDHILGFFRIWSIPLDAVEGILGHFVPAVPVHITEFHSRGIYFDYTRLCKPYITNQVLQNVFGNETAEVKAQYLDWQYDDHYALKPEFDTQRKVETYFASRVQDEHNNKIQYGLYDLISNIVLIEEPGSNGQQFHCRIAMESTQSFQHLDGYIQQPLREIYLNYFYQRQDYFWRNEAMQKLPELKRSTNMLICGEDLGMVPATVPGVMHSLAILSLEIQRMPKDSKREFFHPNDAPYLSVVTPSTHDMSTIRGWWEEDRAATQRFFNNELGQWGTAPSFCEPWIQRIILMQHFYSPSMWSIFQLQDLLGISEPLRRKNANEERINIPANPKHYWRYRMHFMLEILLGEEGFNKDIKDLVRQSGR